ncbi:hypothetical protein LEP1GSC062_4162 [Leptospira alexanderi serovar Manhao 3 str. L 60]|uniref:Uncharacterized protein n=1 Tax=Leptospira alexanderi serovar Manhao 3 str. L 60 TaxID=1049759 RepID=V6HVS3_9LEPT|nr:hypothetical protein LEP1GSC062_4162 [Leptospira alexanderi serovar Manhao 3 str. L 60]
MPFRKKGMEFLFLPKHHRMFRKKFTAAFLAGFFLRKKPARNRALLSGQVIVFPFKVLYFSNTNNLTSTRSLAGLY